MAVFGLSSIACGLAQNVHQLVIARAVQGFGAALLTPGSLALISSAFPARERGRAIGTWSGATAITTAIGPVLGGWLAQALSWRAAFWINVPLAAAVIAIGIWRVPESRRSDAPPLDLVGAALVTLALGGIVLGLIVAAGRTLRDPLAAGAVAVGAVRGFTLTGRCGIPTSARAVAVNVTVTQPTGSGLLTLFPGGTTTPQTSTINYRARQTRANNAILLLGAAGDFGVMCAQGTGSVQFVLDVIGYFQ